MPQIGTFCQICYHANAFHNVWSICEVVGCRKCNTEMECPRCKHPFGEHIASNLSVFCTKKHCNYVVCYTKNHPERGLLRGVNVTTVPSTVDRPPVLPIPWAKEETFPTVPRRLTVTAPTVEEGYL